ncbi:hypothetical protein [Streptomyces sp. NPDC059874]|uniref:hypothetical protein n=1 Tax=Streptomyces sp. NPDC059874 TaxID=3346983 RepID=UPI00366911E2
MTDTGTDSRPRAAGEGTWAIPLLTLAPAIAIRHFTDLSAPWPVIAWVFCALSAALLAAGWVTVARHGTRGRGAWFTCVLGHTALVVQALWLVRN